MSLVPKKRQQHDQQEDAELLKLVGAVLDNARAKGKRRTSPGFRRALHRIKAKVVKRAREHPLAMIGFPACVVVLAALVTVALSSLAPTEDPNTGSSHRRGSSGSSVAHAAGSGALGANHGGGSAATARPQKPDIASDLLNRVVSGDYQRRDEIATGRFLRDFENQWLLLVDVDLDQLQVARRGKRSVEVRGPYNASELRWKEREHLTDGYERWRKTTEASIRIVLDGDKTWKLEHIRVY